MLPPPPLSNYWGAWPPLFLRLCVTINLQELYLLAVYLAGIIYYMGKQIIKKDLYGHADNSTGTI